MNNLKKLNIGQKIKNYKEMCVLLGEDEKIGNSKKSQIKEWERYFSWDQEGHKIVIKEIYNNPKEKIELRSGNNDAPYTNQIQKIMLDLLLQDKNDGQILLSKYKLLQELNMINQNYSYSKRRIPKLSKFLNVNENDVYEFYESSSDMLVRNLEAALNKLRSKAVIFWTKAIMLCTINIHYKLNELGSPVSEKKFIGLDEDGEEIYNHKAQYDAVYNFRKASKDEVGMVLSTENDMLRELGRKDKSEVIRYGEWDKFTHNVNDELMRKMGVDFYYEGYEIIFNDDHVQYEWNKLSDELLISPEEKSEQRKQLNIGVGNKIIHNSTKRHDKALVEINKVFGDTSERNLRRSDNGYLISNKKLVDNLIDQKGEDIRSKVKKTKINKDE